MKTKVLVILLCLWLGGIPLTAQSIKLTRELQQVPMASVLAMYKNEFGSFEKPDLDDTFPYALIRMYLEGSGLDVAKAKERLTLYLGQQSIIESRNTTYSNQILFLVRARKPLIYIDCGDGCEQVMLSNMQQLQSNAVYDCTVQFIPEEVNVINNTTQAPRRQFFKFRVTPENAVVTIVVNGTPEILPMREGGVASKVLNYGSYRYIISADKYRTEEGEFVVSSNNTEMTIALRRPQFGWLTVEADTTSYGAYVFATNTATSGMSQLGTIPLNHKEMESGMYILHVQKEKYNDYTTTITIEENEVTVIHPTLASNFAQVTLMTSDSADILVDGQKLGTGNWSGTLELGEYTIETRQKNHRSAYTTIQITALNARNTIFLNNPVPIYGSLIVDGSPIDATVYVDGNMVGYTPLLVNELLTGTHIVRLEKVGYDMYEEIIQITENQENMIEFSLTKAVAKDPVFTIADNDSVEIISVNNLSFNMIKVEGDTFMMGATAEQGDHDPYRDEYPTHQVILSDYYIAETEVTQELWEMVMGNNPSSFPDPQKPVDRVSWNDCQVFIQKLNALTGKKFRLPTEEEWEFAARGGKKSNNYKYAGSNKLDDVAWYRNNSSSTTHPVKQKLPNELGLYDMSGNVFEWCQDKYYKYVDTNAENKQTIVTNNRIFRGGSWYYETRGLRVSFRYYNAPTSVVSDLGFRLAL